MKDNVEWYQMTHVLRAACAAGTLRRRPNARSTCNRKSKMDCPSEKNHVSPVVSLGDVAIASADAAYALN